MSFSKYSTITLQVVPNSLGVPAVAKPPVECPGYDLIPHGVAQPLDRRGWGSLRSYARQIFGLHYALKSKNCPLFIAFYALHSVHCIICIVCNVLHCILYIVLYAL